MVRGRSGPRTAWPPSWPRPSTGNRRSHELCPPEPTSLEMLSCPRFRRCAANAAERRRLRHQPRPPLPQERSPGRRPRCAVGGPTGPRRGRVMMAPAARASGRARVPANQPRRRRSRRDRPDLLPPQRREHAEGRRRRAGSQEHGTSIVFVFRCQQSRNRRAPREPTSVEARGPVAADGRSPGPTERLGAGVARSVGQRMSMDCGR